MFDLNAIVSAALNAAVQQAVAPLVEQIAKLEAQSADRHQRLLVLEGALTDRVVALENNPAQGVEPAITIDEARMVEALNSQEWFWSKINDYVERQMDDHCETYDHDNYDEVASKVYETDFDDFVTRDSVREEIEDVLNNATISIRA